MNILLTSVGRRAYLVDYFKKAIGENGHVHVCNSDENSSAFSHADASFVSPLIYDNNYIPALLAYCERNSIKILVPLFDIDLPVISANRKRFEEIGISVIVSDLDFVKICNDKWKSYQYLKNERFLVPKTWPRLNDVLSALEEGEVQFPIVVKPRFGCGSIGVEIAEDLSELRFYSDKTHKKIEHTYLRFESDAVLGEEQLIYQELLRGQEFGADVINDLRGNFRNVVLRKKIAMRSGETDIAEIVDNPVIASYLLRLGKVTGHIANLDCDIILKDKEPYIIDMNARFGGGYPFSHMAGCNLPLAIVEWVSGKEVPDTYLTARVGLRGFKEIVVVSTGS